MDYIGRSDSLVFFANDTSGVIIDETKNVVVASGSKVSMNDYAFWSKEEESAPKDSVFALAHAAMSSLDINVLSTSDRMYTIPKSVVAEAKRGLEWRKEEGRGGTKVGMNTARTLAEGGQIGIRKVRHIAKYFPRHEVDKKGKGYKPGEDGYPSNGRIAWALWGGDAAQRWASAIVERENKKAKTASGEMFHTPQRVDFSDFGQEEVRFIARVRKGEGFDRLYKVDAMGSVCVWDDGSWENLGSVDSDIDTYDKALDDPYDTTEKRHIPIDSDSAITLAAKFDSDPFCVVAVADVNPEEWEVFINAKHEIDWDQISSVVAAAPKKEDDDGYTSEERSEKAEAQVRDAKGRFAETGGRVVIGGNPMDRGTIESIDGEKKTAKVKLDTGATVEVPVNQTEAEDPSKPMPPVPPKESTVDLTGILGEPKTQKSRHIAKLPEKLPIIGKDDLHKIIADFPSMVQEKRDKARLEALTSAGEEKSSEEYKDPKESDVDPLYFAIVADDDPQAVMDVVALVPEGPNTSSPMTYKRAPGEWKKDEKILADLNSPTPPPVVQLDLATLEQVLKQVDSAVTAAGTLEANRVNAERLRRYWLYGPGETKVRWQSGGAWERCVEQMSKYMGHNAKGYCALRHKEATGMWAGNEEDFSITASGAEEFNSAKVLDEQEVIENAAIRARAQDARERVLVAGGKKVEDGAKFFIPLVIPEGVESGDGRIFDKESIDIRELPLPLLWQIKTGEGHNGSVVVGRIDHMEKTEDGIGNAYGYFDTGSYGAEAERLVRGGFIRGVSADLDKFEASEETAPSENADEGDVSTGRIKISKARVMAVTLVPKPAFQECTIKIEENDQEEEVVPDGVYVEDVDPSEASALVACGITAGVIPTTPPSAWFENPKLDKATPLTVDDEGRVFGHIAAWHVDHIGMSFGTKPPRSRSGYSYFHTGVVRTEEGSDVPVGQLTLAGGHAALELSASEAVRHYDDTASAIADVHAGEDAYGIWVAGALRPGTTPEQIRALRASAPSGDWRPIKGHLELVAVCQVNVPGFPIARSRVASGQVMALVAAGASVLAQMKSDPVSELKARIDNLERRPLEMAAQDAKNRVLAAKAEELAAKVKKTKKEIEEDDISYMLRGYDEDTDLEDAEAETLGIISPSEMRRLIHENKALPDGKFPIRNWKDLKKAIRAYGWVAPSDRNRVQKHIIMRAKALRREEMIPERWMRKRPTYKPYRRYSEEEEALFAATGPCWEGYEMVGFKMKDGKKVPNCVPIDSSTDIEDDEFSSQEELAESGSCPPATQDIALNLKNRKNAIDTAMYGPLNPAEPNDEYWQTLADEWGVDSETAKDQRCGNCAVFVISPSMKDCISSGLTEDSDEFDAIDAAGELGYCEAFDFKCASARTCRAWVGGGPVTEDKSENSSVESYLAEFAEISQEVREKLASEGKAMPDGAYPIRNVSDLKNAIQAFGRAKESERTAVRKHIVKRARGLGREDLIPENWPEAPEKYKDEASLDEFKYFSPEERERLAEEGKAMPDGSYPIETRTDLKNAIWAYGRGKPEKKAEIKAHIIKRAKDLDLEEMLPDIWEGEGSSFSDEDEDDLVFNIRERLAIVRSVVAAGGLDRNRGNAERLRRYWTRGAGALKIRWGTPGDWKRCVRYLSKYMGPRAKGYCQLRHKEATGVYTGSRFNPGRKKTSIMESAEFTLSEALYDSDLESITDVTPEDLETPVEWIFAEEDPNYDPTWEPDEEIIILCETVGDLWDDLDGDDDREDDDESAFYDESGLYDDYDSVFAAKDADGDDLPDDLTPEEIEALKMERASRARDLKVKKKGRYTAKTQPRDAQGRFRKVLARLKVDLGTAGLDRALEKVEEIENLDFSGDYSKAAKASSDLVDIIDRLDTKALNPDALENVRASSRELGKVIANLPFAFGEEAQKIRFSDMPPALRDLMEDMITRVENKIGKEDSDIATEKLKGFISGNDVFNQSEIASEMSKLLRLLT